MNFLENIISKNCSLRVSVTLTCKLFINIQKTKYIGLKKFPVQYRMSMQSYEMFFTTLTHNIYTQKA